MARFYANENMALPVVQELRRLGHDVLTSAEAGNANRGVPDADVLAFASVTGRVLLTYNRLHFLRLHQRRDATHAGIVLCTVDADYAGLAARIHAAVAGTGEMKDCLLRVNRE